MNEHPIHDFMKTAMESIKSMVDVNTIVGTPIETSDGTIIIPVSKVSFGFVAGGSDIPPAKNNKEVQAPSDKPFGAAACSGVTLTPMAFLIVNKGQVKMVSVSNSITTIDKVIELVPDVIDRIKTIVDEKTGEKNSAWAPDGDLQE
ncbi:MAG: GerW family sporulation protein [Clostridia bacterium]|nr:GerW family sporulation protein [Clostridia bacterium]